MKRIEKVLKKLGLAFFRLFFGSEKLAGVPSDLKSPRRILAVRADARLGNLVFMLPFLLALRKKFPLAQIGLLTSAKFAGLFEHETVVDEVLAFDKKKARHPFYLWELSASLRNKRFDWCFDLASPQSPSFTNSFLSALSGAPVRIAYRHQYSEVFGNLLFEGGDERALFELFLQLLEKIVPGPAGALEQLLTLTPSEKALAANFFEGVTRPRVGLFVGGRGEKMWEMEKWLETAHKLSSNGRAVFLFYGPDESEAVAKHPVPEGARWVAPRPLREFSALLSGLDLFVSTDTGPLHLASALGVPVLGLYFSSDPLRFSPIGKDKVVVQVRKENLDADSMAALVLKALGRPSGIQQPAEKPLGQAGR